MTVTDPSRNEADDLVEQAKRLMGIPTSDEQREPGPDDCARCGEPLHFHFYVSSLPGAALSTCVECGACKLAFTREKLRRHPIGFEPPRNRADTRYCSNACRQRAYRKRQRSTP